MQLLRVAGFDTHLDGAWRASARPRWGEANTSVVSSPKKSGFQAFHAKNCHEIYIRLRYIFNGDFVDRGVPASTTATTTKLHVQMA